MRPIYLPTRGQQGYVEPFKQGSVTIINLILNVAKYHILTTVLLILWTLISISSCETLI